MRLARSGARSVTVVEGSRQAGTFHTSSRPENGEARHPLGTPGFKGWQRPTLPRPLERSTIGATGLNYRVRNGNGCGPCALVASRMCWASWRRPYNRRIGWCALRCEETGRDQTSRAISSARLKVSRPVHLRPINVVVSHGPSGGLSPRNVHLGKSFPLRCFQRLSPRDIATGRCPWRNSPYTSGRFVSVLSY